MTGENETSTEEPSSLQIIDDNKTFFRFFRVFGLFSLIFKNGKFRVDEKLCMISRLLWFLWNAAGIAIVAIIQFVVEPNNILQYDFLCSNASNIINISNSDVCALKGEWGINSTIYCNEEFEQVNTYLMISIGILVFILVDPVQTLILKRNLNFLPKILEEIKYLENIKLGNQSIKARGRYAVSHIGGFKNKGFTESPYASMPPTQLDDIHESNSSESIQITVSHHNDEDHRANKKKSSKCYNILILIILGLSILTLLTAFGLGFYCAVRPRDRNNPHDIENEWKFFGSLFYLVFPVLTTWFCVFFIGYQRKMYKAINKIPDTQFENEESIRSIADYIQSMQIISEKLADRIYKFTFGVNFAIFVIIGIISTFEMIQGLGEIQKSSVIEFGDIIYIFPVAICVFHMFISCQYSSTLVTGQHHKLLHKLNDIMTSLLIDKKNDKAAKKVELLYKNLKDQNPIAEIFGGFKVNYSLFTGMVLFIISYAKWFYKFW